MLRRLRWMLTGMGLGVAGSAWAKRRWHRFVRQHTPPEVASRAAAHARDEWRAVLAAGREGMRSREAELRAQIDGQVTSPRVQH